MRLIVGIDPGLTAAVAIIDLSGNLLAVKSKKEFSRAEIIEFILKHGTPLLIATDRSKPPSMVEKIAANFNCRVFKPQQDLAIEDKLELTKNFEANNLHEKDALASALIAYKSYATQFSKIDFALSQLGFGEHGNAVKAMIMEGKAKNIAEAVDILKKRKEEKIEKETESRKTEITHVGTETEKLKRRLAELQKSYDILRGYAERLEERAKALEKQKRELLEESVRKNEEARKTILGNKETLLRDNLIKNMRLELEKERSMRKLFEEKLERQRELKQIEEDGLTPIIMIENFDKDTIAEKAKNYNISGGILYFKIAKPSKSAARFLIGLQPKVVIGELQENEKEILRNAGIAVVSFKPEIYKFYGAIKKEKLDELVRNQGRKGFLDWLKTYKERT